MTAAASPSSMETGKGRRQTSRSSCVGREAPRRRRLMLEKGAWEEDAPAVCTSRRHALWEKATAAGDSLLDSALRSTSMSRRRRHQGVVADIKADHAHRRWAGNRRFGIRSVEWGGIWVGRSGGTEGTVRGQEGPYVGVERCALTVNK
ncbi:hypothetical protein PR202_gb26876 [Eleusine coracana subsp. coracana]|uniref:Uncharacterized protein n=1 Tax=Eleusine coracana subsp. coracana TaxID=191504 RepID=A0AAV5FSM4_ELECO|nr:hypothetical protein PR202_gb26876 [Eleusine coracana subsp. coracana]